MSAEFVTKASPETASQPIRSIDYVRGIESYLEDGEQNKVLRPHQDEIFHDLQEFLREGGLKGYVTAPTGTGKTVIFVELSKALLEAEKTAGRKPKILVVEPTKDLVHQTLGRSGEKGYGRFAPDLEIASFFSDSTAEDRRSVTLSDITITTYDSLALMTNREEMRPRTQEEKDAFLTGALTKMTDGAPRHPGETLYDQLSYLDQQIRGMGMVSTGRRLIDYFDVIIFDEAHHIMGSTTANIVEGIRDKLIIGFTATPDANEKRRLDEHLPQKIHDLTFKEAISMELLAPVAGIGLKSHTSIRGSDLFDKEGDYQEDRLSFLVSANSRNQLIASAAQILVENGFGTLIPCIPGGDSRHARILADELCRRGIVAEAIYGGIPTRQRNMIYRDFEAGKIDVLTNTRILGEGWDSQRAKAIIEASPTRSLISKRQRIGRVVRPGDIAVVIDILDDYDVMNPPLHLPDLLDGKDIQNGEIYGNATDEQRQRVATLIQALGMNADIAETIPAHYSMLFDTIAEYQKVVNGRLGTNREGVFSLPEKISPLYSGVTDEVLIKLWQQSGKEPNLVLGRQNYNIRALFNAGESLQMMRETPECDKDRAFILDGERWMSAEGFVIGFQNLFPDLTASLIEERFSELGDRIAWRPLKQRVTKGRERMDTKYEMYKAYRADEQTIPIIKQQLQDYFDFINGSVSK